MKRTERLFSEQIPGSLETLLQTDPDCIWHAGFCIADDPELRILEEGVFLDPVRAKAFQCSGCERLSILAGKIHQNDPVRCFAIESGFREGMRFKVSVEDCGHAPSANFNALTKEVRTTSKINDVLIHYIVQHILEKKNIWNVERIYDSYVCGNKVISIREDPLIHFDTFKITKSFVRAGICSVIKALLELYPYNFIYSNVGKGSFIFNSIPCEGTLANIPYKSKNSLKLKNFAVSSISTNYLRYTADAPLLDAMVRHAEARVEILHNHDVVGNEQKCKLYRMTYRLHGKAEDIGIARYIHFSPEINFSLNVYLTLSAFLTVPGVYVKLQEDPESLRIWQSIWPSGPSQARDVGEKLRKSDGSPLSILRILLREKMYTEPFEQA